MRRNSLPNLTTISLLSLLLTLPVLAGPPDVAVTGSLTQVDGIDVLRVWGTPQQRGFAHGYLLADTIPSMIDQFLAHGPLGGTTDRYKRYVLPKLARMKVDPRHEAEMRGILEGLEAKLGRSPQIPFLGRALRYDDIVAVNCTSDFIRSGCSSFAAWGDMTADGHTIAGRNMDWPVVPALLDTLIVMVNTPSEDGDDLGWVSVTWPTYVGCLTGMNAEGVSVATHDAGGRPPSGSRGFTPYSWTFRRALESAHPTSAVDDIAQVIRRHTSIVGNNMMMTRPFTGSGTGALVLEFDADQAESGGLTIRRPEEGNTFVVCTNHFRQRSKPTPCRRYAGLTSTLGKIAKSGGSRSVTLDRGWKMLRGVSMDGILTYHSVIFEPNKRLMHVAFTQKGEHAPKCKKVTLDVTELLTGK